MTLFTKRLWTYIITMAIVSVVCAVTQTTQEQFILDLICATLILIYLGGADYDQKQ